MLASTILLTTLAAVASALPTSTNLVERAGGPAIVPIPSTCTVTDPLPIPSASESYMPGPSTEDVVLYYAYYPSSSTNTTALSEQCLQQCYGYGTHVECAGAYWAENVSVPAGYYGSPGGQLETGCMFYTRALDATDFVVAPEGQATTPFAGNIAC
ncbi:hypothetical protein K504DRAFT_155967 [Pleomassaria siparia CBS 279.74]|uniref:Apple domain-containing protein n=1 Tax=Pleomassaria siparia CBS 279.74 TaxID=1314801 RepID=A0A6G1KNQ6_9PLEO|nr:hypothetical protein K504DRAFT_155967 [Pleomassaria siparia CBS 279.74]